MIRLITKIRLLRTLAFDKATILALAFGFLALARPCVGFAQEALLSTAENYYEFLSLSGDTERPYLNYRTLSDSAWTVTKSEGDIWNGLNLGTTRSLSDAVRFRVYGPDFFSSYNSAEPYGQNDGALWQGKGLNASLTAGARLEAYGFELTLKPQIAFSQNQSFDLVTPAYSGASYAGKADTYGYFGIPSIDAPQRFGDEPFYTLSWGDSEIRYSWKTLTVGFGTQAIWLGPARINPILHSNNAAPYPKLDIGLRKQTVSVFGHDLGDVEARLWWGRTTESEYFDNDDGNDHNLITGFTFSYAPSLMRGLTLGLHRTMLSKWDDMDYSSIVTLVWPVMSERAGSDKRDQRASITASYRFPSVGFEVYTEWARNDFSGKSDLLLRYPFHSQGYTIGAEKEFRAFKGMRGSVIFEHTNLESSRDYELLWPATFYSHGIISQGYTNVGQWLGAGMGTGGNSQYLGINLYGRQGLCTLFFRRQNPDNDHIWFMHMGEEINTDSNGDGATKRYDEYKFKAIYSGGISVSWFIEKSLKINGGVTISDIQNPLFESKAETDFRSKHLLNATLSVGIARFF